MNGLTWLWGCCLYSVGAPIRCSIQNLWAITSQRSGEEDRDRWYLEKPWTLWLGHWGWGAGAGGAMPSSEEALWRQPGPLRVSSPLWPKAETHSAGEQDCGTAWLCRRALQEGNCLQGVPLRQWTRPQRLSQNALLH